MAKKVLGRGLGALISGGFASTISQPPQSAAPTSSAPAPASEAAQNDVMLLAIGRIRPSRFQPRQKLTDESQAELISSIRERGVLQPLWVRRVGDHYELIAGERRFRAAQQLGLSQVPVLVREATDAEALELALIENLQRENLNPMEEARGYRQLIEKFLLRQEDIASRVGKNRATIANALRLLSLPDEVQTMLERGELTAGHARAILGLETSARQRRAARRVVAKGLSVRETERLVEQWKTGRGTAGVARKDRPKSAQLSSLEEALQQRLRTRCRIVGETRGKIEIEFYSAEELDRLLILLGAVEP